MKPLPTPNPITAFHSSLFILHTCHEKLERLYHEFITDPRPNDYTNTRLHDICAYMVLEAASFLDEYEMYFTQKKTKSKKPAPIEPEYLSQVNRIEHILKPVLNTIKRWKDLGDYRDNIVAHSNRYGHFNPELVITHQEPYDIPRERWEYQLMRDLIHLMFGMICQVMEQEINYAFMVAVSRKPAINPLKDNSHISVEIREMVEGFKTACSEKQHEHGRDYSLNIVDIDYPSLKKALAEMKPYDHPLPKVYRFERKQKKANEKKNH
ncbi:MAG: hypothetical protein WDO19_30795 [Bacteroidota bacterium]